MDTAKRKFFSKHFTFNSAFVQKTVSVESTKATSQRLISWSLKDSHSADNFKHTICHFCSWRSLDHNGQQWKQKASSDDVMRWRGITGFIVQITEKEWANLHCTLSSISLLLITDNSTECLHMGALISLVLISASDYVTNTEMKRQSPPPAHSAYPAWMGLKMT